MNKDINCVEEMQIMISAAFAAYPEQSAREVRERAYSHPAFKCVIV
jgi:hypothetical protein